MVSLVGFQKVSIFSVITKNNNNNNSDLFRIAAMKSWITIKKQIYRNK